MKRGLGDVIKDATKAVGIKPCEGCQKRAEAVNEWGRRSFLGKGLMSAIFLKSALKRGAATINNVDVFEALTLLRILNVTHVETKTKILRDDGTHQHSYADAPTVLSALSRKVMEGSPNKWEAAYLKALAPTDRHGEVLAGWTLEMANRHDGYVIILSEKVDAGNIGARREVLTTDQEGVIYRARINGPDQPAAGTLEGGQDFPGAIAHDLFNPYTSETSLGKFRVLTTAFHSLFRPVVLSQCWNECTGIGGCGGLCYTGQFCCAPCFPYCDSHQDQPTQAAKNCGAEDCAWCVWSSPSCSNPGQACNQANACTSITKTVTCCRCPKQGCNPNCAPTG